jgi:hypothetical protein
MMPIRPRKKVEAFRAKKWSPDAGKGHVKVLHKTAPSSPQEGQERSIANGRAGIQEGEM